MPTPFGEDINYFSQGKASSISENTNHHFGRSYFLTSFRGFSGERKIIVNAYYVYTMLYKNVYSLVSFFTFKLILHRMAHRFAPMRQLLVAPTCFIFFCYFQTIRNENQDEPIL